MSADCRPDGRRGGFRLRRSPSGRQTTGRAGTSCTLRRRLARVPAASVADTTTTACRAGRTVLTSRIRAGVSRSRSVAVRPAPIANRSRASTTARRVPPIRRRDRVTCPRGASDVSGVTVPGPGGEGGRCTSTAPMSAPSPGWARWRPISAAWPGDGGVGGAAVDGGAAGQGDEDRGPSLPRRQRAEEGVGRRPVGRLVQAASGVAADVEAEGGEAPLPMSMLQARSSIGYLDTFTDLVAVRA